MTKFEKFKKEVQGLFDDKEIKRKYTGVPYWHHLLKQCKKI